MSDRRKSAMASNAKRLTTSAATVPLIILVMFVPWKLVFLGFLLWCVAAGLREFEQLSSRLEAPVYGKFLVGLAGIYLAFLYLHLELASPVVTLVAVCAERDLLFPSLGYLSENVLLPAALLAILVRSLMGGMTDLPMRRAVMTTFGFIYIVVMMSFVLRLRFLPQGSLYVFYLFLITWLGDAGAYYVGACYGRRKLTDISPKKTWEGVFGGIVGGLASAHIANYFLPLEGFGFWSLSTLVLILSAGDIFGDLFESVIKRSAGVKDSGQSIPGHGGVLDKMDAILFNAPLFYIFIVLAIL